MKNSANTFQEPWHNQWLEEGYRKAVPGVWVTPTGMNRKRTTEVITIHNLKGSLQTASQRHKNVSARNGRVNTCHFITQHINASLEIK